MDDVKTIFRIKELGRSSNGMEPLPLSAKDPIYMLSTPTPVLIDRGLDWNDIVSGDGPFSESNGQHTHCITERAQGRQP